MPNLAEWEEAKVGAVEGVVVFPVLENLTIVGCPQLITTPTHFPSLKNLSIFNNRNPVIAKDILSNVKGAFTLKIDKMDGLTCVSDVFGSCDENKSKDLTSLILGHCSNLARIQNSGTSLQELRLYKCDSLVELNLWPLQFLRYFELNHCSRVNSPPHSPSTVTEKHHHFKSLLQIKISNCQGLTSITGEIMEGCSSLQSLEVHDCPNLISFPLDFRHTPCLSDFWLHGCPKLLDHNRNMPRGFTHLSRLHDLRIGPFADDASVEMFDWSGLISSPSSIRRTLWLIGLPDLESPLHRIQLLTSLSKLTLSEFGALQALPDWLGSLVSLEELELWSCPKLERLPSKGAMSRLNKLKDIGIYGCPLPRESISEERSPGCEWSKISHVPRILIDGRRYFTS